MSAKFEWKYKQNEDKTDVDGNIIGVSFVAASGTYRAASVSMELTDDGDVQLQVWGKGNAFDPIFQKIVKLNPDTNYVTISD